MSENTKIEWATHSFSPWIGCSKVHTGCQNCYAEAMAGRLGATWGPNGTRRRTAESTWKQVDRWNRKAACACEADRGDEHWHTCSQRDRPRVFPSLCDPFEDTLLVVPEWRRDFFALIDRTPNLDWLLLTKRPENVRRMWCSHANTDGLPPSQLHRRNVWLLYSASDQQSLEAGLPHLLECRDLVDVLGLSLEPLIGPVDLDLAMPCDRNCAEHQEAFCPGTHGPCILQRNHVDWVIVGGESGPRHRPMDLAWLESIADQCSAAGVPLFVKQDCGLKAGQQGRIPDHLWSRKEFPRVSNQP